MKIIWAPPTFHTLSIEWSWRVPFDFHVLKKPEAEKFSVNSYKPKVWMDFWKFKNIPNSEAIWNFNGLEPED